MDVSPVVPADKWETMWSPYDEATYQFVLNQLHISDIVLDIGAGDLRLSRRMALRVHHVYALENQTALLTRSSRDLPPNVTLLVGDARTMPFPAEVTTAVLLMRHCTNFALYFNKLAQGRACRQLITNARWGMDVEVIDMRAPRKAYQDITLGWYACRCGGRGFKPGAAALLTEGNADLVWELHSCPACRDGKSAGIPC